ncbi:MAG: tyrosine-type recombinase/integrase [Fusobacterium sp.]|nr:tyrosine-type recombinase/integrase [Fusobacterium sp.]
MKRPNGNGSITKLQGKRRKPYIVRITQGWDKDGKQIKKVIGYFKTMKEANQILSDYLINPFDLDIQDLTFEEIYIKWSSSKYLKVGDSAVTGYKAAFSAFKKLHNIKFRTLKTKDLQKAMDESNKGYSTKRKMKYLVGQLYAYALQNDIVNKDYSSYIELGEHIKKIKRVPFTANEIKILWEHVYDGNTESNLIDTVLIMIYTGFRIQELLELKTTNIDLENGTIQGGVKTEAGKNRLIPIHHKIIPLFRRRFNKTAEYFLINSKGKQMKYSNYYREKFEPLMEKLGMKHYPHDCRHTFATLMNNANANKTAITKLIGHKNYSTVEKIYTHEDIENLRRNIELIEI